MGRKRYTITQNGRNAAHQTAAYIGKAVDEMQAAIDSLQKCKGLGADTMYIPSLRETIEKYRKLQRSFNNL